MTDNPTPPDTPNMGQKLDADQLSRIIMLIYGKLEKGDPFWCYVAIKPSQFEHFKQAEKEGKIDLYNFDVFGEVIVSAEGKTPPEEVTLKVAEMYGADASTFFQPIDPMEHIDTKLKEMEAEIATENADNKGGQ
jgi:hypothetical protein